MALKIEASILNNELVFDSETWGDISQEGKDFIRRMLVKDQRRRASIPELLAHPWLKVGGVKTNSTSLAKDTESGSI